MQLAVLSQFLERQPGAERSLAEIVEGLAMRHGHEIHPYFHRVADAQVTPNGYGAQGSGQRVPFHRVPGCWRFSRSRRLGDFKRLRLVFLPMME